MFNKRIFLSLIKSVKLLSSKDDDDSDEDVEIHDDDRDIDSEDASNINEFKERQLEDLKNPEEQELDKKKIRQ